MNKIIISNKTGYKTAKKYEVTFVSSEGKTVKLYQGNSRNVVDQTADTHQRVLNSLGYEVEIEEYN